MELLKKAIQEILCYYGPPTVFSCQSSNHHLRPMFSVWSLLCLFDVPAPIKTVLMRFTAPFIAMPIESVIFVILYQKKIDIGPKIFEYFWKISCYEIEGIWHLSLWWCRQPLSLSYRMIPVAPSRGGNSIYKRNKKMSQNKAVIKQWSTLRWFCVLTNMYHTPTFSDKYSLESRSRLISKSDQICWKVSFVKTNVWMKNVAWWQQTLRLAYLQ